jgi:hypothetical protein
MSDRCRYDSPPLRADGYPGRRFPDPSERHPRRVWGRRAVLIVVLLLAVAVVGSFGLRSCVGPGSPDRSHPTTSIAPVPGHPTVSLHVTCTSVVGDLTTTIDYRLVDVSEPITSGSSLRLDLAMPFVQVSLPVAVRFISGTTHLPAPEGFRFTEASMVPSSNADFTSTSAIVDPDGQGLTYSLIGSFPMDGTTRNLPVLSIGGVVDAPAGTTLRFPPPDEVTAHTDAGIFGKQDSTCRVESGAIAEIPVTGG